METTIRKWGNSAGIIIPQALLKECGIEIGDLVELISKDGAIHIKTICSKKDLSDVLNQLYKLTSGLTSEEKKDLFSQLEKG